MSLSEKEWAAREKFRSLDRDGKLALLASLPLKQANSLRYNPIFWLRDKQIVPDGDWRYCFVRSGRGFGKTKMGAAWVRMLVDKNPNRKGFLAIVAPTHADLSKVMAPAIISEFPPNNRPVYIEQKGEIRFKNGALIHCYSSDTEIRGGNYEYVWCDEMVKWCDSLPLKIQEAFETLDASCRIGNSKFLITTTPKPFPIFKRWERMANEGNPLVVMVCGSMAENDALSQGAKNALYDQFGGTRKGRQELEGEILSDNPGALWNASMFEPLVPEPPAMRRIVVAIDPAVSTNANSDDTGIIVAGLGIDNHVYILEDGSGSYTPDQWAKKAVSLYEKWRADRIVAEKNNGGALVESNIRTASLLVPIKLVHASKGKITRAEPVSALYEQRRVHHVESFPKLEDECCSYTGDPRQESPDRLDAMVWAVSELLLTQQYVYRNVDWVPQF